MAIKNEESTKYVYSVSEGSVVFEEQGDQFGRLGITKWGDNGEGRLEIRRWRNIRDNEGNEREFPLRGFTFMTKDGPTKLTEGLIDLGYGRTNVVLKSLKERDNFRKSLNSVLGEEDDYYDKEAGELDDEYYNPNELINL